MHLKILYFSIFSAALAVLIVQKVKNQYDIWQMRALWSVCLSLLSAWERRVLLCPWFDHFSQQNKILSLPPCHCTDVPVPLLQVQQHRSEPAQNARDDAALSAAHVPLPVVPGHAQQQGPPAVPSYPPPQRGTRLRRKTNCHCKLLQNVFTTADFICLHLFSLMNVQDIQPSFPPRSKEPYK